MTAYFLKALALLFWLDWMAFFPFFGTFFGKSESDQARPVQLLWLLGVVGMACPWSWVRLAATVTLWAIARHYFIDSRWSSVRRGGGAPGFMSHWTLFYAMLLQFASFLDGAGRLHAQVLRVMRVDFAVIMICAGLYKVLVGYLRGEGMEYGRANPLWGYHWRHYSRSDPARLHVRVLNLLGSTVEMGAGILMLMGAPWSWFGALSITLGFVYVAAFIRLGRLAFLMMLLPCIYAPAFEQPLAVPFHLQLPDPLIGLFSALCLAFIALLPLIKVTQYTNLFLQRQLPQPWQGWCTTFANHYPIIIWRVFTADVTNFFVRIYQLKIDGRERNWVHEDTTYCYRQGSDWATQWRFLHVTESIALVSVFTTLRYFPSQPELFEAKLVTYARSLRPLLDQDTIALRFETVVIEKGRERFDFKAQANHWVDLEGGMVRRQSLDPSLDFAAPARFSPVVESQAPGSYEVAPSPSN